MSFNDECLSRYIESQTMEPGNPVAGLGYLLASVVQRKTEEENERRAKIYFVTINPRPDVKFDDFRRRVVRYFSKYPNSVYGFEIRGKNDLGYHGIHCHAIVNSTHRKNDSSTFKRNVYSSFKDMVGNRMHVDVRLYSASYREDKISYIKGEKWDEDKLESVELTKAWREDFGIEPIYVV